MSQARIYFSAPREAAYAQYRLIEAALEDEGHPLAIIETDEAARIFEVSVYAQGDAETLPDRIRGLLGDGAPADIRCEILPEIDWVAHTLEALAPVRAGRFLVHGAHDRDRRRPGDIAVEIEAGLAFGTGHHGTTSGCLETIAKVVRREHPQIALDLGTGSAVLAIALARLARIPVLASDIDPVATRVAAQNAKLNGVASLVEPVTATGFAHPAFAAWGRFDLVVANILARPLMRLAPEMAAHLAPGGSLILSGILERQRRAVLAAYCGQRFRHVGTLHREGWVTLHLKR